MFLILKSDKQNEHKEDGESSVRKPVNVASLHVTNAETDGLECGVTQACDRLGIPRKSVLSVRTDDPAAYGDSMIGGGGIERPVGILTVTVPCDLILPKEDRHGLFRKHDESVLYAIGNLIDGIRPHGIIMRASIEVAEDEWVRWHDDTKGLQETEGMSSWRLLATDDGRETVDTARAELEDAMSDIIWVAPYTIRCLHATTRADRNQYGRIEEICYMVATLDSTQKDKSIQSDCSDWCGDIDWIRQGIRRPHDGVISGKIDPDGSREANIVRCIATWMLTKANI